MPVVADIVVVVSLIVFCAVSLKQAVKKRSWRVTQWYLIICMIALIIILRHVFEVLGNWPYYVLVAVLAVTLTHNLLATAKASRKYKRRMAAHRRLEEELSSPHHTQPGVRVSRREPFIDGLDGTFF